MEKASRQAAPPLPAPGKGLSDQLQRSIERSEERIRDLERKLKETQTGSSRKG
ncbi:MAG TPA: hypothetical protein VKA35_04145 [Solirubrobacterales bacterium]|nr:hypothetical protein [Solirubrobacterales bacterium]